MILIIIKVEDVLVYLIDLKLHMVNFKRIVVDRNIINPVFVIYPFSRVFDEDHILSNNIRNNVEGRNLFTFLIV